MRLPVILLILLCTAGHAADLFVAVKETKTGRESFFRIDTDSFRVMKSKQPATNQLLPKITKYKVEKRRLIAGDQSLIKADNILLQCSAGDTDFVVVRQEHNSLASPLRVLSAFSGHPVQVSKIVIVKIADGKLVDQRELTRRASSYDWTATVSQ